MIQRLLRSRWPYVVLLGFLVVFYVRAAHVRTVAPVEVQPAPAHEQEFAWWPKTLDASTLQRLVEQDPGMAAALSVLSAVLLSLGVCGVGLTLWGLAGGRRRTRSRPGSHRVAPWSFGEVGRILILMVTVASLLPFARLALAAALQLEGMPDPHLWITGAMLCLDVFIILAIVAFAAGKGQRVPQLFGFSVHRPLAVVAEALRGYVTAFPWLFLLLFLVVAFIRRLGWTPPPEPIQELIFDEHRLGVIALIVLLACLVAPVAEELFFRGVLYAAIRRRTSRVMAVLGSGAAFALIHMNPVGFLPIMALGCLLAYLYERTGSLLAPITVHILHNTVLMSLALVVKRLMALT